MTLEEEEILDQREVRDQPGQKEKRVKEVLKA